MTLVSLGATGLALSVAILEFLTCLAELPLVHEIRHAAH